MQSRTNGCALADGDLCSGEAQFGGRDDALTAGVIDSLALEERGGEGRVEAVVACSSFNICS